MEKHGWKGRILGHDIDPEFASFIGKTISKIWIAENRVNIEFTNGTACAFECDEPDCCANHYMHSDDNLNDLVGKRLIDAVVKTKVHNDPIDSESHQWMFFEIVTDKGSVVCSSHNQNNGYYNGVGVNFKVVRSIQTKRQFRE